MLICKKCNKPFSRYKTLKGGVQRGKARKHCIECRPFGGTLYKTSIGDRNCVVCGRGYVYNRKKGNTTTKCGNCICNLRRFVIKKKCIEYKGGKCEKCGYSKCLRALVFHHKDPKQKDFPIGGNHCRAWKFVESELDKCSLLCSNCHAEAHDKMTNDLGQHVVVQPVL
jgi:hypothetical protein